MPSKQIEQVHELLKSIETGDAGPISFINPNQYIQHNLGAADGLAGFGALMQQVPKDSAKVNTKRLFQDGEVVFAHTEYNFFGPKIGFDVFRFADGKIVEHWDNLQETPTSLNPSQHSMVDGPTESTGVEDTEANKSLVRNFVTDILMNGQMGTVAEYFDGDNYIQHNPHIGDGPSGLGKALAVMAEQGVTMKYETIHQIFGEGNFVLSMSEGAFAGKHVAFYDLFRLEAGKIAEHWDTIQEIPESSEWKNTNGKF